MKNKKRTFGVRQVGVFFEKIRIEDDGFYYKTKEYRWSDVVAIKRSDDLFNMLSRFPSSTLLLNDGNILRLPITLEEAGKRTTSGVIFGESGDSYKECLAIFEKRCMNPKDKYNKFLRPSSYIMFYRFGIAISGIQCFILILVMLVNHSVDSFLRFLLCIAFTFFILTFVMMLNRHSDERTALKMLNEGRKSPTSA